MAVANIHNDMMKNNLGLVVTTVEKPCSNFERSEFNFKQNVLISLFDHNLLMVNSWI
jgi:hypothetical protein